MKATGLVSMTQPTKAVVLAAGYGTRFLPATKAMPKEILPVVGKPVIQYVVEDAVAAGVTDVVIVTSALKRPIEDHFDYSFELEQILEQGGKKRELAQVRRIARLANFIYVRQKGRKGTLAGLHCGFEAIGHEPFFGLWGDNFFVASPTRCQQLAAVWRRFHAPVLSCIATSNPEAGAKHAFIEGEPVGPATYRVRRIVEKPGRGRAPSTLAGVGCGILTPAVMARFEPLARRVTGEVGYTDAVAELIRAGQPVYAVTIDGRFYDCGSPLDYIQVNIELALNEPGIGSSLRRFLGELDVSTKKNPGGKTGAGR